MGRMMKMLVTVAAGVALFAANSSAEEAKGKLKTHAAKAKTISVKVEGKGVMLFRYTDQTKFANARNANEIGEDDTLSVEFSTTDGANVASAITRVVAKLPEGVSAITMDELQTLVKLGPEKGNYVLVDSRPVSRFNDGHIPTAISVPFADLEKTKESRLPADKSKPLIFYCGGVTCVLSPKSAGLAKKLGYANVRVFSDGEPAWKKAELPLHASLEFVKEGNIVLVDLRDPAKVAKGYIPRAVNIPAGQLASRQSAFPASKGAPIVFYSDNEAEMLAALETTRDWEYNRTSLFPGGVEAWKAKGLEVKNGAAPTAITWTRKLAPGEIYVADLKKAIETGSAVSIDGRTPEEFAAGHLKGAINVPADEAVKHLDKLPKDKQLISYCSTGARAEMVYDALKDKGFNITFTKAGIEFAKDGSYKVLE